MTPARTSPARGNLPLAWRIVGRYLPAIAIGLAFILIVRELQVRDSGASAPDLTRVAEAHQQSLADNIAFFEARVAAAPTDTLSLDRLTNLYLQRARETGDASDIQRASVSATRSIEALPGSYPGLVNLALVRVAEHDFAAALSLADSAIAANEGRADAYALRGDALMALGRYDDAGEAYATHLERAPGFAAFSRQAALAEVRGRTDLAQQFWHAAIDVERTEAPANSAWARVQLAHLLFNLGDLDAARDEYRRALDVFPGYLHALAGLGRTAAARGDVDEAVTLYQQATASVPHPEYIIALGEVLESDGRRDDAERQFALADVIKQLQVTAGTTPDLFLVLFEADHGDPALAVEQARATYAERPSIAAADALAWSLYRAGDAAAARPFAETALATGVQEPVLLFHAGMIAFANGDNSTAQRYLESAMDLNPRFHVLHAPVARETLEIIGGPR